MSGQTIGKINTNVSTSICMNHVDVHATSAYSGIKLAENANTLLWKIQRVHDVDFLNLCLPPGVASVDLFNMLGS